MGDFSGTIDVERLISYGDDLIEVFMNRRDVNNFALSLEGVKMLQSSCEADFSEVKNLLEEYRRKIDECKQRMDDAKSEVIADADIEFLQKELDEEIQKEHLLKEELRIVSDEIDDLEQQRVSIEERRQFVKKLEKDDLRAQKELSMYASVTKIIPDLDNQTKISGHIVDKHRKMVERFEFDPMNASTLETCNRLWKMTSL
uniref:Uncharacterized protein n=1 Tax=Nelumbo nucifera TaxID=4432 RepID=A0A822ZN93_NELNU|nr:TPA_asm: hypothetical protein HUJ06_004170 [Nelumbo nucifera]